MEVPAHLRIRMAKRNLSHAYLVVGENRRPLAEALGRRLGLYRGDPSLRALPGLPEGRPGNSSRYYPADPEGEGLKAEEVRPCGPMPISAPMRPPKRSIFWSTVSCSIPRGRIFC